MALTQTEALKIVADSGLAHVEDLEHGGRRIVLTPKAQTNWRIILGVLFGGAAMFLGGWATRPYLPEYLRYAPFGGASTLMFMGALMVLIGLLGLVARLVTGSPGNVTVEIRSGLLRIERTLWRRPHVREYPAGHVQAVFADAVGVFAIVDQRTTGLMTCADGRLRVAAAWLVATALWGPDGVESNRDPDSRAPAGPFSEMCLYPRA